MYLQFAETHYCGPGLPDDVLYTAKAQKVQVHQAAQANEIEDFIRSVVGDDFENLVLSCFSTFNSAILATNFFLDSRAAISFRLDPDFLSLKDCPDRLQGMFFVCGANFCGLHLRLRDVSRGGIRLVISQTEQSYKRNAERFLKKTMG
jgi:glutamate dehydrogenase